MVDTVLTPVIYKLIQLLLEEAKLVKGVHREVNSLKEELEIIQCFLRDAGARLPKGETSDGVKAWMKQVKEEADHIEYVVHEYVSDVAEHRRHQHGFTGFLRKTGRLVKALKPSYDTTADIKNIKASLREIKDRGERYGLKPLEQGSTSRSTSVDQHDPRLDSLFIEEDELVGIDSARQELTRKLIEGGSRRAVISLVGEGGIGKTTLAKKVYDNEITKGNFSCHAWITVSQSYNMEKLLKIMIQRICQTGACQLEEINTMEGLVGVLRQYLQAKRYVIFFDDVWDMDFWSVMKHALPNNSKGSRVIITTRNDGIAVSCKESSCDLVHKLQPLSQDMALKLFCKKSFRFELEGHCPDELRKVSLEIVRKCQGLPLVIAAVAGLLSTKEVMSWKTIPTLQMFQKFCLLVIMIFIIT